MYKDPATNKNSKTTKTIDTARPLWYIEALAQSLIMYAEEHKDFKAEVKKLFSGQFTNIEPVEKIIIKKSAVVLYPSSRTEAISRADYLLKEAKDGGAPGAVEAAGLLKSYVLDYPLTVPKQLIIGIVGLAIIGPTLGLISRKKTMVALVNKKNASKTNLKLAQKISAASQGVMKSALTMADGNLRQLDPDMAEWFFGEKHIAFYEASGRKIKQIKKELSNLGIPYALESINDEPAVLAISPVVSSDYSELYWEMERTR